MVEVKCKVFLVKISAVNKQSIPLQAETLKTARTIKTARRRIISIDRKSDLTETNLPSMAEGLIK